MGKTEDLFMRMIEERIEAFKDDLGDVYFDEDVKNDFQSKNVYRHLPRSGMWIREDIYYALKHSESLRDEIIKHLYESLYYQASVSFENQISNKELTIYFDDEK